MTAPELRIAAFTVHLPPKNPQGKEWTEPERVAALYRAGFRSVAARPNPELSALAAQNGMDMMVSVDANEKNWREALDSAKASDPARVNVQVCDHDTPPAKAVKVWLQCVEYAKGLGLEIDIEVHRDTATETPEKCWEIARLFQKATGEKIRFCWDFSHPAVIKHLAPPFGPRLLDHPDLVQISRQFHFRPFNGHHCQIPVLDAKGEPTPEFADYRQFMDDLLACWFAGAQGGEVMHGCVELIPGGYGITTFGPQWDDVVHVKDALLQLWQKHLRHWRDGRAPSETGRAKRR
jgi:hypothetical protein